MPIIEQGILADRLGFDSAWSGDHFLRFGEPIDSFSALIAVVLSTKRIVVSNGVTDPYRRHPASIAHTLASMSRLSNGRANLGIGAGEAMNLIPFGISWDHPLGRLDEAVNVIRLLWRSSEGSPVRFTGKYYNLKDAYLTRQSLPEPHPKIYIGALGPKTRRLAGKIGDGYYSFISTPEMFRANVEQVKEGVKASPNPAKDFDVAVQAWLALGKERESAFKLIEPRVRQTLVLEGTILRKAAITPPTTGNSPVSTLLFDDRDLESIQKTAAEIPEELIRKASNYGSVDDVIEDLQAYIDAGATHLVLVICNPDLADTLKKIKEKVIPQLQV